MSPAWRRGLRASVVASEVEDPRARVVADLPWHTEPTVTGLLRIAVDALVLTPGRGDGARAAIPLGTISRASIETTFGMLPALHVWHTVRGREFLSRFEFSSDESEPDRRSVDAASGITERIGPGIARDAAQRLEGGIRALGGGLNMGMRTARQAVEGIARQDEYKTWPSAIAAAQARARSRGERAAPASRAVSIAPVVPHDAGPPAGGAETQFQWFRELLLGWLNTCATRARELNVHGIPVIQHSYPLDSPVCRIVVLGEFSRGKSTLINALFGIHGEIALPTGMTPTTPIACAVRVPRMGESDGATVSYRTSRPSVDLSLEEFRHGVRLAENESGDTAENGDIPLHLDEARSVEIRITGAYLPAGVVIEDTPGLHEESKRSAGSLAALGRADLVLFVLAADQLLGEHERQVIDEHIERGFHRNVLFLVNFWDSIEGAAQREILQARAASILGDFPSPFRRDGAETSGGITASPYVFFVSALQASRHQRQHKNAPAESGIPRLRAVLRGLLGPGSDALLLRSRAGRALRYAMLLRQAVSKTAASLNARPDAGQASRAHAADEAVAAALRAIEGLPGAVSGATARQLAGFEAATRPELRRAIDALRRAAATGDGSAAPDIRRMIASDMRSLAAHVARSAQEAVDLTLAQTRAAYLARELPSPVLDARIESLPITMPSETSARALLSLIDDLPGVMRADLDEKARRAGAAIAATIRDGAERAGRQKPADVDASGRAGRERLDALRVIEDDLLRLELFLQEILTD